MAASRQIGRRVVIGLAIVMSFGAGGLVQKYIGFGNIVPGLPKWKAARQRGLEVQDAEIFLLVGQSNMAGTAQLARNQVLKADGVFVFRDDQFSIAVEPINPTGVGPGLSFATSYRSERGPGPGIVLLPVVAPGSNLRAFLPSDDSDCLYARMIRHALGAKHHGKLSGLLFFQGESDTDRTKGDLADDWGDGFTELVNRIRRDLRTPDLAVVFAQIGPDPGDKIDWKRVQERQAAVELHNVAMIRTSDLEVDESAIHFTLESYIEIGKRFASKMARLKTHNDTSASE